jgi:hypothetical protein
MGWVAFAGGNAVVVQLAERDFFSISCATKCWCCARTQAADRYLGEAVDASVLLKEVQRGRDLHRWTAARV